MQRPRNFVSVITTSLIIGLLCAWPTPITFGQRARVERRVATGSLPPPRFADPERARKLAAAFPEIERLFNSWFERVHAPGAVMGIIIDGELVWVKTAGCPVVTRSRDAPPGLSRSRADARAALCSVVRTACGSGRLNRCYQ